MVSPSSTTVVTASDDSTLRLWDYNKGECLHTIDAKVPIISAHYFEHIDLLLTLDEKSCLSVWHGQKNTQSVAIDVSQGGPLELFSFMARPTITFTYADNKASLSDKRGVMLSLDVLDKPTEHTFGEHKLVLAVSQNVVYCLLPSNEENFQVNIQTDSDEQQ